MKVYISLPITGHDIEEVEARCIFAKAVLKKKGHTPVSPLDVSDNPDASYAEHMGRDISALLECDAVVFLDGWRESKGCTLEHAAAKIYNKLITYELCTSPTYETRPTPSPRRTDGTKKNTVIAIG